jgi:hypothetical protein
MYNQTKKHQVYFVRHELYCRDHHLFQQHFHQMKQTILQISFILDKTNQIFTRFLSISNLFLICLDFDFD